MSDLEGRLEALFAADARASRLQAVRVPHVYLFGLGRGLSGAKLISIHSLHPRRNGGFVRLRVRGRGSVRTLTS